MAERDSLSPPIRRLIDALAREIAEEHLRPKAPQDKDSCAPCSNPVPLRDIDQAA